MEYASDGALKREAVPIGQDFKREPPGLGSGPQSTRAFPGPSVEGRGAIGDLAGSGGQPRRPLAGARGRCS